MWKGKNVNTFNTSRGTKVVATTMSNTVDSAENHGMWKE